MVTARRALYTALIPYPLEKSLTVPFLQHFGMLMHCRITRFDLLTEIRKAPPHTSRWDACSFHRKYAAGPVYGHWTTCVNTLGTPIGCSACLQINLSTPCSPFFHSATRLFSYLTLPTPSMRYRGQPSVGNTFPPCFHCYIYFTKGVRQGDP